MDHSESHGSSTRQKPHAKHDSSPFLTRPWEQGWFIIKKRKCSKSSVVYRHYRVVDSVLARPVGPLLYSTILTVKPQYMATVARTDEWTLHSCQSVHDTLTSKYRSWVFTLQGTCVQRQCAITTSTTVSPGIDKRDMYKPNVTLERLPANPRDLKHQGC